MTQPFRRHSGGSIQFQSRLRVTQQPLVRQVVAWFRGGLWPLREHVCQIRVWINAVAFATGGEAEQDRRKAAAIVATGKRPIPAPDDLSTQGPFADVVVD